MKLSTLSVGFFLGVGLGVISCSSHADLVVVVGSGSPIQAVSKAQVTKFFLSGQRALPNGLTVQPVDLLSNKKEKARFYRVLVNKDTAQIAAYWARLVFAGTASPPLQAASIGDLVQYLTSHPDAVAYIDRKDLSGGVRPILDLP